jgi:hypothetical protein
VHEQAALVIIQGFSGPRQLVFPILQRIEPQAFGLAPDEHHTLSQVRLVRFTFIEQLANGGRDEKATLIIQLTPELACEHARSPPHRFATGSVVTTPSASQLLAWITATLRKCRRCRGGWMAISLWRYYSACLVGTLVCKTEDRWHLRYVARFLDFRAAVCENADDMIRVRTCSAATLLS